MSKSKLSKPAAKAPGKPGLLARLFGAEPAAQKQSAAKPAQQYTGPAKDPRVILAQQIRAIRAKLDPKIVRLAEKIARKGPPATDQERATLAIELFLAQKQDGGDFAAKLKTKLDEQKRRSH
ncbi:MAG: hypothetical protein OJJ21_09935 [Ferrovibrio sp.]|uniref:hypothetical protein n=1 Tax=Ferrovibrio sp. TaxID=1917215 RepID=UPI002606A5AE|nr:hypothetical protein [Ferrovibrio sp.]MCW0233905.1 hypothetical protein [Ferrovibrio sp.]